MMSYSNGNFPQHIDEIFKTIGYSQIPNGFSFKHKKLELINQKGQGISFDLIKEFHSHSRKTYSINQELLAKALDLKNQEIIVDATFGTGKDSCLILSFGKRLLLLRGIFMFTL